MNANGSVFKYPDNVDTDVIIPARYLNTPNAQELATHCMEDIDKEFIHNVKDGDIMVGGWNFSVRSMQKLQSSLHRLKNWTERNFLMLWNIRYPLRRN